MSEEAWRAHERRWRQEPSDQDALGRAIAGLRRSGLVVPPDLLDARVEPATLLETSLPLEVWAVLPGEREPTTVGWGPGRVEVPPHRYWGVGDVPAGLEGLGALGDELRARSIPGLRLRQFERSRKGSEELPLIDEASLAALGPQPQLRWLELDHYWNQPSTPGQAARSLGCRELEIFRGERLVGLDEAAPGRRLEGCEELLHLRELVLSDQELVADDLRPLEDLPQLDGLFLTDDALILGQLERARFAPRLRRLRVGRLVEADAQALGAFPALTELTFGAERFPIDVASTLATLPGLSAVEAQLRGLASPSEELDDALERLRPTRLERLSVGGHGFPRLGDRGLAAALSIEGLRSLELRVVHEHAGDDGPSFQGLTSLELMCGEVCWRRLAQARTLRSLDAVGSYSDLAGALAQLTELTRLRLGVMGSAGKGRAVLPRLHHLTLMGSLLPIRIEAPLRSLSILTQRSSALFDAVEGSVDRLEHLRLDTELSEDDLAQLERLQSLRQLELAPFPANAEVVDRVLRVVRTLPGLRRLAVGRKDEERPMFHMVGIPELEQRLADEAPWVALVSSID